MDRSQLIAFCDYMIGDRVVGGTDPGDPLGTPYSPELRAFVVGRLGDKTPQAGYAIVPHPARERGASWTEQAQSLAALLREVADGIDPAPGAGRQVVCDEIVSIMEEYDQQDARGSVDTPGGLEHMGDVWKTMNRWRKMLVPPAGA